MKALILASAVALMVTPALAVPYCSTLREKGGLVDYGFGYETEQAAAARFEDMLRGEGVDAHQTRFWNGCIQTFVNVDGKEEMRFFDPSSLQEIPVS